ncbi:Response regulator [Ignavibacterium album JCM 16511]|uniref:Response regulator n=1 Tax=Ignavibacterium album (strain DSM 19864 / JCM 16511 / NBRC 101810 / Mat9-16) TaxID=945713 RepID=I0AIL0_IGNAJ|nr:sigma-54-dependent Fis family transcriptional regulator [Ignavibacterium album]AFH48817.1 Response regulator [Ignavibacterium album JCM 16511]
MSEVQQIIDKNTETLIIPDGIIVIGKDKNIIVFNEAASRITGFSEDEVIGENFEFLFKKNIDEKRFIIDALEENLSISNLSINITDFKGNLKNVLASISPIKRDGNVLSVVFVFRDTKEMLSLAEEINEKTLELIDQKNKLDAIFNSNIEGTFTIDNDWTVTSFNTSAEKITGYKKTEAIGKKCWEIFNSSICRNGCHMEQTLLKGKAMVGNELEIVHKNGIKIPIRVNSNILINNKNEKIGAVETFLDISELKNLSAHLNDFFKYENIVGRNKEIKQIISVLESVSQTDTTVLITGESGTGKELAARAIHLNSSRKTGPFIAVNCSAFVESLIESELFGHEKGAFTGAIKTKIGKFELAQGGTLFLDEIGDLSIAVQTKLLRVLETREFERVGGNKTIKMDARIIAATNKNLMDEIAAGRFREDLFYRLNVINIHLPPLRERMDDLPLIINHFIESFNQKFNKNIKQFSSSAFDILMEYNWPGNIRELENVIEHCFVLCSGDIIQVECLPKRLREQKPKKSDSQNQNPKKGFKDAERELIISILEKNNHNRTKAAKELNINPSTLWRKMKKLGIKV